MAVKEIIAFLATLVLSSVTCLDLERLGSDCLQGKLLTNALKFNCANEDLSFHYIKEDFQAFYCINYEKKQGEIHEYDLLSIEFQNRYKMKFVSHEYLLGSN